MIVEQEIYKVSLKIGKFVTLLSAQGGWPLWTKLKPGFYW